MWQSDVLVYHSKFMQHNVKYRRIVFVTRTSGSWLWRRVVCLVRQSRTPEVCASLPAMTSASFPVQTAVNGTSVLSTKVVLRYWRYVLSLAVFFCTCVRYSTIWEVNEKCFTQLLTDGVHERLCTCTCIFSTELLSCLMQKINAKYCSQFLRMFSLFTRHEAFVIGKPRRTCDDIC